MGASTWSKRVTEALDDATQAESIDERIASGQAVSRPLREFFDWTESQPELKARKDFRAVHGSLVEVEKEIQRARRQHKCGGTRVLQARTGHSVALVVDSAISRPPHPA
jgi:hypothetical protein